MAIYKLLLPKMGESVSEATLTKWLKTVGDTVQEDDAVVEIATDKVDSDVPSPVEGTVKELLFEEGDVVQVGDAIALIEIAGEEEEASAEKEEEPASEVAFDEEPQAVIPGIEQLTQPHTEETVTPIEPIQKTSDSRFYSPLVKSIAEQEGVRPEELERIPGSGAEGRVTKHDILAYLSAKGAVGTTPVVEEVKSDVRAVGSEGRTGVPPARFVGDSGEDEIIEMDRMRRLIADHMVHSIHTSPHVFSVVEADVTDLVHWRNKVKNDFKKREGENITFTPLIIEAITKALKDFPMINVSVDGYNIIKRKHINIGMAAALPSGNLIVPVIKDADQLSLVGLSKAVNDLAGRARANQLKPDDTQGGTFTFTNIGAFGNIFGMPIINQPQAAILAVGTITKKPAVLETEHGDVIAIRHKMYLTMSYDHRVIDGALGGSFIRKVADYLENWDKERII
ncbi:2-oxo acid dehydrogenase subunit E2 [Sphingobacterium sp. SGG-5]|uniref:dihydrolipoamide acetyltransferase family protein n=1 Tax=Sphingobacterium sp. SGG-5 TaxID=2710881 RepID=UPI0013EE214A|nr:dihydrolipoamide acetyltransferase family protein [Sphingobacterium sp. SGG-5]NGM62773.1 2-oxo acid dehydrogenase subunit E2 [Sphingobacterium sp. SGG-5]